MAITKLYRNTTDKKVNVVGIGVMEPGQQVSITTDQHQPVILENYPGVVDVTDETTPAKGK